MEDHTKVRKFYKSNGNPAYDVSYVNGVREGLSRSWWHFNNELMKSSYYKKESLEGEQINFYYGT
jgi:antitoxin component YwqK of YwqJK toxin-antitoxin module